MQLEMTSSLVSVGQESYGACFIPWDTVHVVLFLFDGIWISLLVEFNA